MSIESKIEKIFVIGSLSFMFTALICAVMYCFGIVKEDSALHSHDSNCDQYIVASSIRENSNGRYYFTAIFPNPELASHCSYMYNREGWIETGLLNTEHSFYK